jgi:hypothetical protein
MGFFLFILHRVSFLSKDLFNSKMEVRRNNLKVTAKKRVETKEIFNRGKRLTQKKNFILKNLLTRSFHQRRINIQFMRTLLKITKLDGYAKRRNSFRPKS